MTHGTIYAYRKGCRCGECKAANYRSNQKWRAGAAGKPIPDTAHGTLNGYNVYGCRCDSCKQARATSDAAARERRARIAKLAAAGLPADWEGDIPAIS